VKQPRISIFNGLAKKEEKKDANPFETYVFTLHSPTGEHDEGGLDESRL
jgi:hypothetical protein